MNLLQIVSQACNEMGIAAPSTVAAATDLQTIQMYSLVNREGNELRQMHDWTELQAQYVITVHQGIDTTGDTVDGSTIITNIPDTSGITAQYYVVSGDYVNQAARVVSVDSSTQVTLNIPVTATQTGAALTFTKDTWPEPSDFDHFINETWWDVTNHWMLLGPDSPQRDEQHRSGIVTTGPRRHFRQVGRASGSNYRLWPPISSIENDFSIEFEYVSNAWVQTLAGAYQSSMTADTDICTLDPQAVVMGLKWRFFQVKQLDFAPMQAEYLDYVNRRIAQDGGAKTQRLDRGSVDSWLISPAQVPDGNWPGGA